MSILHAVVLGLVQGVTEFVPVSSSAHLVLFPWLLKWPDQGMAYDVALHWGTLLALVVYFREDLRRIIASARKGGDLAVGIVIATVPGVVAGLLAKDYIEVLFRKPEFIAVSLASFGILLGASDYFGRKRLRVEDMDWKICLGIGAAQALAIVPGVSRSGITLTAALFLGLQRVDSARFSFLLAVPIVFGAGVLKLKDVGPAVFEAPFWIGIAASALSGFAAIHFLLEFLKRRSLWSFAVYRVALGAYILYKALWIIAD